MDDSDEEHYMIKSLRIRSFRLRQQKVRDVVISGDDVDVEGDLIVLDDAEFEERVWYSLFL